MSKPLIKRIKIKGVNHFRDFDIEFEHKCSILIGDNGVGKTTILNIIFGLLTQRWLFLSQCAFDYIEIHLRDTDPISFSHAELDGFIISNHPSLNVRLYAPDIDSKFRSLEHIIQQKVPKEQVVYLPTFRKLREELHIFRKHFDYSNIENTKDDLYLAEFVSIGDEILIPEGLTYLQDISTGNENKMGKFLKVCNSFLVNTQLRVNSANNKMELINKFTDEKVALSQLSSGEKQVIYTFSKLYLNNNRILVFLFDEPELSLSLPWQRLILPEIIESGYCDFLFVITHSPFVFDNNLDKYAEGINVHLK